MKGRRLEMGPRHAAESISKPEKSDAAYSTVRAALQIKGREKEGFVYLSKQERDTFTDLRRGIEYF